MLLAIDVGNTNVTAGVFQESKLAHHWRLQTIHERTSDEWGVKFRQLFALQSIDPGQIDGILIASVVPPIEANLAEMARNYFGHEAGFVTHKTDTGIKICYDNPRDVGADRIVNAVAAFSKYGGPCIIVDLGTAITFDAVSAEAEYLGGVIGAGIGMSIRGLFQGTARLPMVDFREPESVIGTNTVGSIQSGLYYGAVGMIDGIIARLIGELGPSTKIIATGGQAAMVLRGSRYLSQIDENLTLEGLQMIWERNH